MISVENRDTFIMVTYTNDNDEDWNDALYLNFPIINGMMQLYYTKSNMYENVKHFNRIPVIYHKHLNFSDNFTHKEIAKKYLDEYIETKDSTKLVNFMIDFYKSVMEIESKN
jgi:hypothetical protein